MRSQWATSKDVAERAQVSRAAVSAVLSGRKGSIRVSDATRARILQAAAELNYTPNHAARNLRKQRSGAIAFAVPSFEDGLYERTIPRQLSYHLMRTAVARGCQLIEMALPADANDTSTGGLDLIRQHQVDGVIVGWPETTQQVEAVASFGVPVVQVMKPRPATATTTITVDPAHGMTAAVEHLARLGHQRIAYLGVDSSHPVERSRLQCFHDAVAHHRLASAAELVALSSTNSLSEGLTLTQRLLDLYDPPTALIAGDGLVLGALRTLYDARRHVPTEVSVVGFDDELAASLYPPLSSIRQPIADVATLAVDTIENAVADPTTMAAHIVLPTSFSRRESTAPNEQSHG